MFGVVCVVGSTEAACTIPYHLDHAAATFSFSLISFGRTSQTKQH